MFGYVVLLKYSKIWHVIRLTVSVFPVSGDILVNMILIKIVNAFPLKIQIK